MFGSARLGAVAVLAAALLPVPAAAQAHHAAVQPVAFADWLTRVEDELGRQLAVRRLGNAPSSGVVRVKFNCSEDGRTRKVSVVRASGSLDLDLAAAHAVRRIAVMHPLPAGMRTDQVYYADIVFGGAEDASYHRRVNAARAAARTSNAWFKAPEARIASLR